MSFARLVWVPSSDLICVSYIMYVYYMTREEQQNAVLYKALLQT